MSICLTSRGSQVRSLYPAPTPSSVRGISANWKSKATLNGILAKHCKQPVKKIEKDTERDFFMGAEEAVKYRIVDQVVTPGGKK